MGSLILESFFGIPGLGSYTIDAINQQDFAIVRAMVFLGSVFVYRRISSRPIFPTHLWIPGCGLE